MTLKEALDRLQKLANGSIGSWNAKTSIAAMVVLKHWGSRKKPNERVTGYVEGDRVIYPPCPIVGKDWRRDIASVWRLKAMPDDRHVRIEVYHLDRKRKR